ncbi:unnamed protein product [Caretta caretta]
MDTINQLKQEVRDAVDRQHILEEKDSTMLKGVKLLPHQELKQADKEQLQEILTNSKTQTSAPPRPSSCCQKWN